MASNSTQVNKNKKQVASTMAVQVQSASGSCESTPMDVIDETRASTSTSIPNVIDYISDMISDYNTLTNEESTDTGYSITSDERRALMNKIERL
ncbi:hypothetical protein [Parasitella parasitica]|uniref:Uncharacterized protein n=1 Tax=Parasitella parasitica TaxID=35722 RepID=A0A0B7N641_9FUNG|nr:hypothetical protein [Parasitella parasitica]